MRKHIVKEVDQKYDSMNETKQAFYKYGSNCIIEESANIDDLNEQSSRRFSAEESKKSRQNSFAIKHERSEPQIKVTSASSE